MVYASEFAKDLGKGGLAFATGWTLQELENWWYAYQNGLHANLGESVDGFISYWSPLTSPWNFVGLLAGLGLSVIPKKQGSTGRSLARLAGHAILGAEGWGYAQHNQSTAGVQIFKSGGTGVDVGHTGPPEFIFGRPEWQNPATARVPNLF